MFDDAFANFEGQIEPGKIQISLLELLDDAQCVKVVIEAISMLAHAQVQLLFAAMPERRVANVVNERKRFRKIFVKAERPRHGPRDLCNLDGMRESIAEVVREASGENLRFRFQPAEGPGVDDAVAVARVIVAVGVLRLRIAPAARVSRVHGIGCEGHFGHSIRWAEFPLRVRPTGGLSRRFAGRFRPFATPNCFYIEAFRASNSIHAAANSKDFRARLGLAWEEGEGLVGLFRNGRVRVFLFYLAVELGCFAGIFRAVVLGKGQHHDRLGNQDGGICKEMLVKHDGIIAVARAVVDAGQLELSERGYVAIAAGSEGLQGFLGVAVLADPLQAQSLVVAGEFSGARAGIF